MLFVKIHKQILNSSVANDYRVRRMFQDLLLLADWEGTVDMTHEAIARQLGAPLTEVVWAIGKLQEPDLADRSGKRSGIRLELLDPGRDWGWRIVNYKHYRELRDNEQHRAYRRAYMRPYMQRRRERERKAGQTTPERCEDDARTMDKRCVNSDAVNKCGRVRSSAVGELTKVNNPNLPSENVNSVNSLLTPVNPTKTKNNIYSLSNENDVVSFAEAKRIIGQISEVAFSCRCAETSGKRNGSINWMKRCRSSARTWT
jgi:hypothetical protein